MAQEVERRLGKAEVTGSNPVSSSNNKKGCYRMNFSLCKQPFVYVFYSSTVFFFLYWFVFQFIFIQFLFVYRILCFL